MRPFIAAGSVGVGLYCGASVQRRRRNRRQISCGRAAVQPLEQTLTANLQPSSNLDVGAARRSSGSSSTSFSSSGDCTANKTDPEVDILQFDSAVYYVEEEEEVFSLDVVRLGTFEDTIQVSYYTEDASAKAGRRYVACSGTLVFEPQELSKTIRIPIINTDDWNTTLEFKVCLHDPRGCELGRYLFVSRVKVIDNDCFPTNRFQEEIRQYGPGKLIDNGVPAIDLIIEYFKLNYDFIGIKERTWATLTIDQLQNLYYLLTIYLLKYVADDVLGPSAALPLLVTNSKELTLLLVGALYVVPYGILNFLEYWKSQLQTSEMSMQFLQDNIFRKFTNYSEQSRSQVKESEMSLLMVQDVPNIVENGYMRLLDIVKYLGKLVVSSYFIVRENPDTEGPLVISAIAIASFVSANYRKSIEYNEAVSQKQADIVEVVQETNQKYRLIADYYMRPQVQNVLQDRTSSLRLVSVPAKGASVSNDYFPGWISTALVSLYLWFGGSAVVEGAIQIGAFLATINAVKDIGDSFKDIFTACLDVGKAIGPVARVTEVLNLPTNLLQMKRVNRIRRRMTKEFRTPAKLAELRLLYGKRYGSDAIPILLQDMCFAYPDGDGTNVINNANLSVQQGNLVAVVGNRRGGKSTFMKLLGNVLFPTEGFYFVPSFLRILHVSVEPTLLNRSLWSNLAIGRDYWRDQEFEVNRILRICRRIGLSRGILDQLEEQKDAFLAGTHDSSDTSWQAPISQSEKVLIHLARAFIYNPEVLVMNRPTTRLPDGSANIVIKMISEFVTQKGVELPQKDSWRRRPRTAFVSFVRLGGVQAADVVWKVDQGNVTAVDKADVSTDWIR